MNIEPRKQAEIEPPNESEDQRCIGDTHPTLMSLEQLQGIGITYSKEHLRRLEADGLFPVRVHMSAARVAWVEGEIIQWIRDLMENRTNQVGRRTR